MESIAQWTDPDEVKIFAEVLLQGGLLQDEIFRTSVRVCYDAARYMALAGLPIKLES